MSDILRYTESGREMARKGYAEGLASGMTETLEIMLTHSFEKMYIKGQE